MCNELIPYFSYSLHEICNQLISRLPELHEMCNELISPLTDYMKCVMN